jgi:hypothetical protein
MCEKYNGWKNYETWNVKLWIDNEESTANYARELARGARECNDNPARALAGTLEELVTDNAPDIPASTYADLLGYALKSVDWYEIAEAYLSDLEEEARAESAFLPEGK